MNEYCTYITVHPTRGYYYLGKGKIWPIQRAAHKLVCNAPDRKEQQRRTAREQAALPESKALFRELHCNLTFEERSARGKASWAKRKAIVKTPEEQAAELAAKQEQLQKAWDTRRKKKCQTS